MENKKTLKEKVRAWIEKRRRNRVTILYNGIQDIDKALESGSSLRDARDKVIKKYAPDVNCYVGASGDGISGSGPWVHDAWEYRNFVVNLEADPEQHDKLRDALESFTSNVPELPIKGWSKPRDLYETIRKRIIDAREK